MLLSTGECHYRNRFVIRDILHCDGMLDFLGIKTNVACTCSRLSG